LLINPRRRGVVNGRHTAPPDRGDAADKWLSERRVGAQHARRVSDVYVRDMRELDEMVQDNLRDS
jgi:hypothetical protein